MREQSIKRAVSVSVDARLLDEANRLNINLSETLERRLHIMIKSDQEKRWIEDNKEAFAEYNASVEQHGPLSDDLGLL